MNLNESLKVKHILVIVDHFTRYTRVYVTKYQKALTAAKTLYKGFISIFGSPKRILTDQGKAFTSEVTLGAAQNMTQTEALRQKWRYD